MKSKSKKLLFAYNADSNLFSLVSDYVRKMVSPETYQCNLCKITYGNFGMKKRWQSFINSLAIPVEFLHKDEIKKNYPDLAKTDLPAVFLLDSQKKSLLLSAYEINKIGKLDKLITIMKEKLKSV